MLARNKQIAAMRQQHRALSLAGICRCRALQRLASGARFMRRVTEAFVDVRFTPKSGHRELGRLTFVLACQPPVTRWVFQ